MKTKTDIDNQKEYWDRVAEIKTFTHPIDTAMLSRYITPAAAIADYGCGYGRLVKHLLEEQFKNSIGFDTSAELIHRGQREQLPVHHIATPAHLPLADNSTDCFLLFAVLTCIPSNKGQRNLIDLLYAKLKPGGIIYISDYYLQQDQTETSRYGYLNDDPDNSGVFTLPEGVMFRHHSKEWIAELTKQFELKEHTEIDVRTMNGHVGRAFQLIAQKA